MKGRAVGPTGRKVVCMLPGKVRRRERYRHLIESGAQTKRASNDAHSPERYAAYVIELGEEPIPDLARSIHGGRPRVDTQESRDFKRRYHVLRGMGQPAVFASEYGRTESKFQQALRIIAVEEEE